LAITGPDRLAPQVQEMLYRIAQEALNNISKHAEAEAARVALTCSPEEVVLVIADDGRGFDRAAGAASGGMGLGSMRERAAKIRADFRIESHPGGARQLQSRGRSPWRSPPRRGSRTVAVIVSAGFRALNGEVVCSDTD
jgi:signal transduction histidine kinase